jgi:alpha-tubulin suppressor-like RCC1 family protein
VLGASALIARSGAATAFSYGSRPTTGSPLPRLPASASAAATAIAAGGLHTCARTSAGGVKCWGGNAFGELGDGTTTERHTPVAVSGLASGMAALAAGADHTCALTSAGAAKCWGTNGHGQLGDGTRTNRSAPVDVSGLASGVAAIAAGADHSCVLTSGGGVKCWGANDYGQLGDGTLTNHYAPAAVSGLASGVQAIAAHDSAHTCALLSGGGVKCWGRNVEGELGDGTTTIRDAPVAVSGLASGVLAIAGGETHTCAMPSGGGVKCWGDNAYGQLGDGTTINRSRPVSVTGLGAQSCVVPKVKGKTLRAAETAIGRAHCKTGKVSSVYSKTVKKGRVISQKPRPGKRLRGGSKVDLIVSRGEK